MARPSARKRYGMRVTVNWATQYGRCAVGSPNSSGSTMVCAGLTDIS